MAGTVSGTEITADPPAGIAVEMVPWPPWLVYGVLFTRILYETCVPAGIGLRPMLRTVVWTGITAPARPAFGRTGSSVTRLVNPLFTAACARERMVASWAQRALPGHSVWPPVAPTM